TKNKTDREAYNGCCPRGHRHSPLCLRVCIDETIKSSGCRRLSYSHESEFRAALDRSSDTLLAFSLRAVEHALRDHSRPHVPHVSLRKKRSPSWHDAGSFGVRGNCPTTGQRFCS